MKTFLGFDEKKYRRIFADENFILEQADKETYPRGFQPIFNVHVHDTILCDVDPPCDTNVCFGCTEDGDYKLICDREYIVPVEKHAGDLLRRRITGERLLFDHNCPPGQNRPGCFCQEAIFFDGYEPAILCAWSDDHCGFEDAPSEWKSMSELRNELEDMAVEYLKKECGIFVHMIDYLENGRGMQGKNFRKPEEIDWRWRGTPICDICGKTIEDVIYEANCPREGLRWATMCEDCFIAEGATLRWGQGHRYVKADDEETFSIEDPDEEQTTDMEEQP
ncbi:MAG: hypothetical protein MJ025_04205 [Victivallaceae bacterium]|nr:hypothetical protein [Victivallaceae bacterium]